MSNTHIIGHVLVDCPGSALNNAGIEQRGGDKNVVTVKKLRWSGPERPYVSPQAWRYWWRETLANEMQWDLSPVTKLEKSQSVTAADPFSFPDDDVFGYMSAIKTVAEAKGGKSEKGKDVTVTRLSPLKVTPLIAIGPREVVSHFESASRHEGDPVPYEHEWYRATLQGFFSVAVDQVGRFSGVDRTGYLNYRVNALSEEQKRLCSISGDGKEMLLPEDIRRKRVGETLRALAYQAGGAKLTGHLTSVEPQFIMLAMIRGGNHLFFHVFREGKGETGGIELVFDKDALAQVVKDYKDRLLSEIYIGHRKGFLEELRPALESLGEVEGVKVHYRSPVEAIHAFWSEVEPKLYQS